MNTKNLNLPKISVIIPSYNQGNYIEQTIKSITDQNYPKLELIIIDGKSTDNTVDIIRKYEKYITYWVSEKDRGQSDAINKGFSKATGEILGWINSDDYYLPGYLLAVGEAFSQSNKLDIVYGNSITLDERDGKTYYEYGKFLKDRFLVFGGVIASHTTFWRKGVHQPIDEKINCAMDYELWLRLLSGRKYLHINRFGGVFRLQNDSKSMGRDLGFEQKWKDDYEYIFQKHKLRKPSNWLEREFRYCNKVYAWLCEQRYLSTFKHLPTI